MRNGRVNEGRSPVNYNKSLYWPARDGRLETPTEPRLQIRQQLLEVRIFAVEGHRDATQSEIQHAICGKTPGGQLDRFRLKGENIGIIRADEEERLTLIRRSHSRHTSRCRRQRPGPGGRRRRPGGEGTSGPSGIGNGSG